VDFKQTAIVVEDCPTDGGADIAVLMLNKPGS
jgi:hypothetical protein